VTSSAKIAGGDIQLSVDRATASAELQQLRSEVRSTFAGMSDDALKFASAQDRLDRALKSSNGKITSSVRSAELNLRRVQAEATKANQTVVRSASQASGALDRESAAFGRLGRGALAGSGLLRGLGRSVAFASSTFLGGFGLLYAIESSTSAAVKQQEAEGQLETALRNRGQAVEQLRGQVNSLVAANAKLGFGEEDTTKALTLAVTTTGSLAGATRLLSVAQNVARAKGTDLYSGTQLVVKGFLGQSRGLKSLGVDIAAGVKGWAALDAVQGKYSGRAVAYANSEAGARARARAELERTRVTIGDELLPVENKLATAVADFLGKEKNQEAIQRDVNQAIEDGSAIVHGAADAYKAIHSPLHVLIGLLGGARHATILLLEVYGARRLATALSGMTRLRGATAGVGKAAVVAEGETVAAMAGITAAETTAATEATALRTNLLGLGALQIAPIVIPLLIDVVQHGKNSATSRILDAGSKAVADALGVGDSSNGNAGFTYQQYLNAAKHKDATYNAIEYYMKQRGITDPKQLPGGPLAPTNTSGMSNDPGHDAADRRQPAPTTTSAGTPKSNLDRYSRIQLAIAAAKGNNAKLIAADKALIAYDLDYERKQEALLKSDPKNAKQHAEILQRLYGEQQAAQGEIDQIESDAAAKRKEAADKAAAAKKKHADAVRQAHLGALATTLGRIESRITGAETGETSARSVAQLKMQHQREVKARQDLVAFYVKESHDHQLTATQRAAAVKNAAKARQDLQKLNQDDKAAELKFAVDTAESAVLSTTEGTSAYAKAIAAEKRALAAEIAYYKARASRRGVSLAEKRKDVAEELAAKKQLASLDKKTATASKDPSNAIREATATLEQIIANESNVRQPDGSLDGIHGTLKQMRVHALQSENHLLNIRGAVRTGPQLGPEFGYALRAGDAAFA
jgi:hypothetical protein